MLAAATELLVESGPRAVTVDAVVERSGVAKSTLYRHWESRVALLIDVIRDNAPDVEPPDLGQGFEAALRAMVHQVAEACADPEWARIVPALFTLKQQIPEMAELTQSDHDDKLAMFRAVLDQGVAEGLIPDGLDTNLIVSSLVGPLVFNCVSGLAGDDLATLADFTVDRFIASYR